MSKTIKRFTKYLIIGVCTTFFTWLIWDLLIFLNDKTLEFNEKIWFSISQYTASILMIYPSFYFNRKWTFKDKKDQDSSYKISILKAYIIYIFAPILSSFMIFLINTIFPKFINFEILLLNILWPFGKLFLQVLGLAIGVIVNYFGQKLWIYKSSN
jgi:putative flippase GtrA